MQNQIDNLIAGQFNAEDDLELTAQLEELMSAAGLHEEEAAAVDPTRNQSESSLPAVPAHPVLIFPAVPTGDTAAATVSSASSSETDPGAKASNVRQAVPS